MDEIKSFEHFKINRQLLNAIEDIGYEEPTEIQKKVVPLALAGHDILGIAQTGTGKTVAYLLPLLMKLKYAQDKDTRALILVPTRELSLQVAESFKQLAAYTDLRFACLYGGIGAKAQIEEISKGVDALIATPGRFMDIYFKGEIKTKQIKTLILDEADKMMDMGFMPQTRKIMEVIPVKKQKLLFSATFPPKVQRLSEEFLDFPMKVEAKPQSTVADTVKQVLFNTPSVKAKINLLEFLLKDGSFNRVIIFTKTKQNANDVFKFVERKITKSVRVIHSNKGQNTRINAINEFKEGGLRVLVSTDVLARGIDVSMVSHVINFDVPLIYEDYVHRIGRTGRASQSGKAITFANEAEVFHIKKIEKIIRQDIPREMLPVGVEATKPHFEEQKLIKKELDEQRMREDPNYQGAFHEKKKRPHNTKFKKRKR